VIAALLIIGLAITAGDRLPLLASGGAWTSLNAILNGTAAILLAGGVALILLALRPPRDLFLWLSLALAAIAIGNVLTIFGGGRYTVGWYACRLSWLVSSGVLLLYFLGKFVRQEGELSRTTGDLEEPQPREEPGEERDDDQADDDESPAGVGFTHAGTHDRARAQAGRVGRSSPDPQIWSVRCKRFSHRQTGCSKDSSGDVSSVRRLIGASIATR